MIGNVPQTTPPTQYWRRKFPSVISGILSFVQFVVTIIIIGCEVGSILIDIVTATIYVGLWASLFFIIASISQAATSCCCRTHGCGTYTLIIQLISMFFAICVIGFDSYYIVYPSTCFFPSSTCAMSAPARGLFYSTANFDNIKIPLIKGQLGAGAVMFVLCLVYVIIYIITSIRVHRAKQSPTVYPQAENPYPVLPTVSNGIPTAPPMTGYRPPSTSSNGDSRIALIVCPTCNTVMNMTATRRLPM